MVKKVEFDDEGTRKFEIEFIGIIKEFIDEGFILIKEGTTKFQQTIGRNPIVIKGELLKDVEEILEKGDKIKIKIIKQQPSSDE